MIVVMFCVCVCVRYGMLLDCESLIVVVVVVVVACIKYARSKRRKMVVSFAFIEFIHHMVQEITTNENRIRKEEK